MFISAATLGIQHGSQRGIPSVLEPNSTGGIVQAPPPTRPTCQGQRLRPLPEMLLTPQIERPEWKLEDNKKRGSRDWTCALTPLLPSMETNRSRDFVSYRFPSREFD